MSEQLTRLARPIPKQFVSQVPAGGGRKADYVSHAVIKEILLLVCGPYDWKVEPVYEDGKVVGALGTLSVTIDGRPTTVTAAGDTTGQESDGGSRLKNAESDAFKRCAMHIGLGLELWSRPENYFLHSQLTKAAT